MGNFKKKPKKYFQMADDAKNIVIDNGSGVIKAGFAGENQPSCKFPSIPGVPRSDKQMLGVESKSEYIGDEAQKNERCLKALLPNRVRYRYRLVPNGEDLGVLLHQRAQSRCLRVQRFPY